MSDYSLVPVDYPPDFENVSLIPVGYDPFSVDRVTQLAQAQQAQAQTQPAQPTPQGQPQQPATDVNQPVLNAPATGNNPGGLSGGAGSDPNNPSADQGGSSEPAPFGGYANPTPTESLVNQSKMADQRKIIDGDPTGAHGFAYDEEPYAFVTTKKSIARYLTPDQTGQVFTEISPFYARQGSRFAIIDARPERPVTVTTRGDGTFTISRP